MTELQSLIEQYNTKTKKDLQKYLETGELTQEDIDDELITESQINDKIDEITEDLYESILETINNKIERWGNSNDIINYDLPGDQEIRYEIQSKVVQKAYQKVRNY